MNNCSFCVDIARAMALQGKLSVDKVNALGNYADAPVFSGAEKAARRYVEETTVQKKVADETFASMKNYYTDKQIAEITVVNAIENFYHMINIPLEIEAGGLCALVSGYHNKESVRVVP